MGKVTDYLIALVKKQVDDHGIVVWYDPEKNYTEVVQNLSLPGVPVLQFKGSYFELREQLEPFLEFVDKDGQPRPDCGVPPKVIVYVPQHRAETHHALVEAECAGVVIEPGQRSLPCNTRLRVIAEAVFRTLAPQQVDEIAKQVESGAWTLSDLDWRADQAGTVGSINLIFGTTSSTEVALEFVASDQHDKAIQEKQAMPELAALFKSALGIEIEDKLTPEAARKKLQRVLLLTDLVAGIPAKSRSTPPGGVPMPVRKPHIGAARDICKLWRNRVDLRQAYVDAAQAVEAEAGVNHLGLPALLLSDLETFPFIEKQLVEQAEKAILDDKVGDALELASRRKNSFWSLQLSAYQLHWTLIENAARVLLTSRRIAGELKAAKKNAAMMAQAYTDGTDAWCVLDTCYRQLERQFADFDPEPAGTHDQLQKVIEHARQRYSDTVGDCAEAFARALAAAEFQVAGVQTQDRIFADVVAPLVEAGRRTAYVLVDALRFEMGRELVDGLNDFEVSLKPAIAQLPTITEVGMASLLPGAEHGMELADAGNGKVCVKIGANILKDRPSRVEHLQDVFGEKLLVLKLSELMKPTRKQQERIQQAMLLVVTSQEIDRRGEEAEDEAEARRYMDEVLGKLRKGIRRLGALGVEEFVVTADHGHLFGDVIVSGMKIEQPGGQTVDLHPRVWIGYGGRADDAYLRVSAAQIGLGGNMELAFPFGLACFAVKGGASAYLHGGISLQEMVVPMAMLRRKSVAPAVGPIAVNLTVEKPAVTTRVFSVTACYTAEGLFAPSEVRIRLLVLAKGKEVGRVAYAESGFQEATGEIVLKRNEPNIALLRLDETRDVESLTVVAIDAATDSEVGRTGLLRLSLVV
ncbi:MAG TPA: PglZ domain-containing protein [Verrucomicrobiota bacterium]|nr:PglZ domain-containing protein [Verrucomicrobiota bacterium]